MSVDHYDKKRKGKGFLVCLLDGQGKVGVSVAVDMGDSVVAAVSWYVFTNYFLNYSLFCAHFTRVAGESLIGSAGMAGWPASNRGLLG
mmetsp:Transcript_29821/g.54130  ORF Transcript_29821/g.54130 Transcript_29821/m.54130 type:complete len:88 (+) Transcript_29821:484-747(+)